LLAEDRLATIAEDSCLAIICQRHFFSLAGRGGKHLFQIPTAYANAFERDTSVGNPEVTCCRILGENDTTHDLIACDFTQGGIASFVRTKISKGKLNRIPA
jgi:hypothetical protein